MDNSYFFQFPDHLKILILDEWLASPANVTMYYLQKAVSINATCRAELARLLASPDCIFACGRIKDYHASWLVQNNVKIRSLSLSRVNLERSGAIQPSSLRHTAPTLRRLELNLMCNTDIYNSYNADDSSDFDEQDRTQEYADNTRILNDILDTFTQLEHISVERTYSSHTWSVQLGDYMTEIFTRLVHLKSVCLCCTIITGAVIDAICAAPCLTDLAMVGSFRVASDAAARVAAGASHKGVRKFRTTCAKLCFLFPEVLELTVTGKVGTIVLIAEKCTRVITATFALTDVMTVCNAENIAQQWRCIQHLTITTFGVIRGIPLTNHATAILIAKCSSLVSLFICPDAKRRDNTPLPVCVYASCYLGSKLTDLTVSFMSEDLMRVLAAQCPFLHRLHIIIESYSASATSQIELYRSLRMLGSTAIKYVRLVRLAVLSDHHLSALNTVETLVIEEPRVVEFTQQSIVDFAATCTRLRALHLREQFRIGADVGLQVLQVCATLNTFTYSRDYVDKIESERMRELEKVAKRLYPRVKVFKIVMERREFKY